MTSTIDSMHSGWLYGTHTHSHTHISFPVGSQVKNPPANAGGAGDTGSIHEQGKSLKAEITNHSSILALKISHRQRSLSGYTPWSCKVSDVTEHTCAYQHIHTNTYLTNLKIRINIIPLKISYNTV